MPLPFDSLSEHERREFCRRLKVTRERKGITLATIAERTKIRASLFAALEQNDLRAWPVGIYRRAYFREYARILDDSLDETCEEFNRLFTVEPEPITAKLDEKQKAEEKSKPKEKRPAARVAEADLRLVFDTHWNGPNKPVVARLLAAIADSVIVGMISAVMSLVSGFDAVLTIAVVTMAYFSLGTVLFGESPSRWMIAKRGAILAALTPKAQEPEEEQAAEQPSERQWISDATRVGSAPPSQLRVRFKV